MTDFKNRIMTSKPFATTLIVVVLLVVVIFITLGVVVARNTWLTLRLSSICPDYFAEEYAYVVDEEGRGIDSAAVALWDNSNFNMIYRTFTDSNGRFILFHDFGSFALHNLPFSYYLNISVDGWSDTIRYSFEKYRVCHFRKKIGPDTIVCSSEKRSKLVLRIGAASRVTVEDDAPFAPFAQCALRPGKTASRTDSLPFKYVFYGDVKLAGHNIPFALIPITEYQIAGASGKVLTEGVWYTFDRNGNGKLGDEKITLFTSASGGSSADCFIGSCRVIDSTLYGGNTILFECSVSGARGNEPVLHYRRADAVQGIITVDSISYAVQLWDAGASLYSNTRQVVLSIDRDRDSAFALYEGSPETYEHTRGTLRFGTLTCKVDTISADGLRIFCSNVKKDSVVTAVPTATHGTWTNDIRATVSTPFSLYQTCAANSYVILCFFEGNAARYMLQPAITALVSLANEELGSTYLVGVNRRSTGDDVCELPVINENKGWSGPLVTQFHNFRDVEIVCLDNTATIVYRGPVGAAAVAALWKNAAKDDATAQTLYEQSIGTRVNR